MRPLATELAGPGYVVYAYDDRGQGASLAAGAEPGELGDGGWSELVRDIGARSISPSRSGPTG